MLVKYQIDINIFKTLTKHLSRNGATRKLHLRTTPQFRSFPAESHLLPEVQTGGCKLIPAKTINNMQMPEDIEINQRSSD